MIKKLLIVLSLLLAPIAAHAGQSNPPGIPYANIGIVGGVPPTSAINALVVGGMRDGAGVNGSSSLSASQAFMRSKHILPAGASAVEACYYGWITVPAENAIPPSVFTLSDAAVSAGGTGYAVGDTIVENGGYRGATLLVTQVTSDAVTKVNVVDPGVYVSQLADGAPQASTSGSGSGAAFSFSWTPYAYDVHVGVEPIWNTQVSSGFNSIVQGLSSPQSRPVGIKMLANSDVLVPSGGIGCTQPIPVNVQPGGAIGFRDWFYGYGYKGNILTSPPWSSAAGDSDFYSVSSAITDRSISGTVPTYTLMDLGVSAPNLILVIPKVYKPSVCIVGDSIPFGYVAMSATATAAAASSGATQITISGLSSAYPAYVGEGISGTGIQAGTYVSGANGNTLTLSMALTAAISSETVTIATADDKGDANGNKGWIERALNSQYPLMTLAAPSNELSYYFSTGYGRFGLKQAILKAGCTNVGVFLGVNDFHLAGVSAANFLIMEQQFSQELHALPSVKQVFTDTNTPDVTVSGSTQTPVSDACTQIAIRNADLRNGLQANGTYSPNSASDYKGVYDFVLDTDASVESATTPCTWGCLVNTGDGLHPSMTGHPLIASFVQANLYADLK